MLILFNLRNPPLVGFELSIYDAYSPFFWFIIIISNIYGISILIYYSFTNKNDNWLIGFLMIVLSNSIFLGLPSFRGYVFFPKEDALEHVGWMKDIIATGHFGSTNIYPIVHIFGVIFSYAIGLNVEAIVNIIVVIWTNIYLLGVYILSLKITNKPGQSLFIIAFACPLIFSILHTLIHPAMFSLYMIPFLLYFYYRTLKSSSNKKADYINLILLSLLITFTHPITCLFAIILLYANNLSFFIYNKISNYNYDQNKINLRFENNKIPLVMAIVFFLWYAYSGLVGFSIRNVYEFFLYFNQKSLFDLQMEQYSYANISLSQTIELLIFRYGGIFIYVIISIFAIFIVFNNLIRKKSTFLSFNFVVQLIVSYLVSLFSLFGLTGELNLIRISRFFLNVIPIVNGYIIYEHIHTTYISKNNKKRLNVMGKTIIVIITIFISLAAIISYLNVYGSPRTVEINRQVTRMELTGTKWYINNQYRNIVTSELLLNVYLDRFEDFHFGVDTRMFNLPINNTMIPSHFGYESNISIIKIFNYNAQYMLIGKAGREMVMYYPENLRYRAMQYTEKDFLRLNNDIFVTKCYTNLEFEVRLISSVT